MRHNGIWLSDKMIRKAAIYYNARGHKYLYRREALLSDGRVKIGVYERLNWTGYTPCVATVIYKEEKE